MIFFHLSTTWLSDLYITKKCDTQQLKNGEVIIMYLVPLPPYYLCFFTNLNILDVVVMVVGVLIEVSLIFPLKVKVSNIKHLIAT